MLIVLLYLQGVKLQGVIKSLPNRCSKLWQIVRNSGNGLVSFINGEIVGRNWSFYDFGGLSA